MKLKFYGTGAGYGLPEVFCGCRICEYAREHGGKDIRSRNQAVIDDCLGLEFPVDTFAHCAYGGLRMRNVRHILITHAHHDHLLPEDAFSRAQNIDEVHFYTSEASGRRLNEIAESQERANRSGVRKNTVNYKVRVHPIEHYQTYEINGYQVTPVRARHHENLGSSLFIIRKDGKSIFWAYDSGKFHQDVYDYIEKNQEHFDLVVLECTLTEGKQITDTHMDLTWAAETKDRLTEMGAVTDGTRVFISHIGHLVECTHEELCVKAARYGIEVAYDGLEVEF